MRAQIARARSRHSGGGRNPEGRSLDPGFRRGDGEAISYLRDTRLAGEPATWLSQDRIGRPMANTRGKEP